MDNVTVGGMRYDIISWTDDKGLTAVCDCCYEEADDIDHKATADFTGPNQRQLALDWINKHHKEHHGCRSLLE
jgi:hypothetical protein